MASSADIIDPTVTSLRTSLCSEDTPLAMRFRALFSLKHVASQSQKAIAEAAIDAIAAAFASPSALLKHELAYCLGQTRNLHAVPPLRQRLATLDEDPMVRHEAAEALGAIGHSSNLDILRKYRDREGENVAVAETCEIAIDRIEWESSAWMKEKLCQSDFCSIDPAPPLPGSHQTVEELGKVLMNAKLPLFERYRAMFALRGLASPSHLATAVPAVHALAQGLSDPSDLFRHEIAFVFGQLSHPASIPALTSTLGNPNEASMVRHEAAEALGSLGKEEGVEAILKGFLKDPDKVVHESVMVALDMTDHEKRGQAEYALIPEVARTAA